jgi:hypothetical protein
MQGQDRVRLTCLKYLLSQAKLISSFILFLVSIVRTHQSNRIFKIGSILHFTLTMMKVMSKMMMDMCLGTVILTFSRQL